MKFLRKAPKGVWGCGSPKRVCVKVVSWLQDVIGYMGVMCLHICWWEQSVTACTYLRLLIPNTGHRVQIPHLAWCTNVCIYICSHWSCTNRQWGAPNCASASLCMCSHLLDGPVDTSDCCLCCCHMACFVTLQWDDSGERWCPWHCLPWCSVHCSNRTRHNHH